MTVTANERAIGGPPGGFDGHFVHPTTVATIGQRPAAHPGWLDCRYVLPATVAPSIDVTPGVTPGV